MNGYGNDKCIRRLLLFSGSTKYRLCAPRGGSGLGLGCALQCTPKSSNACNRDASPTIHGWSVFGTWMGRRTTIFMANMEVDPTERSWARWEWIFGVLIIVSLIASSRLGHRLPMILQNFAQLVAICAPLLLTMMSWVRLARVRKDGSVSRWRFRVSFLGCVALSFALLIPLVVIFFSMLFPLDWLRLAIWSLASSLVALLAGCFGAGSMRFPLILGGLVMGGLVVIVPVGIL